MGLSEEDRKAMLWEWYGKTSLKELTAGELKYVCDFLASKTSNIYQEKDKARKRLIRAIKKYCEGFGYDYDVETIKRIAERAAKMQHTNGSSYTFNEIPLEKLRALYGSFTYMNRSLSNVIEEAMAVVEKR